MKNKNTILVIAVLMLQVAVSQAKNYYLSSNSGSFTNDGLSKAKPFKGLGQVPVGSLQAGDSVLIKGGEFIIGGPLRISTSGNSTSDIVVSSYDNILPTGETLNGGLSLNGGIVIDGASNITIKDIILKGDWNPITMEGTSSSGIAISPTTKGGGSIAIIGCEISGFFIGISGYYDTLPTMPLYSSINILYNYIHNNGRSGIDISAMAPTTASTAYAFDNIILYKNILYNNLGTGEKRHTGNGVVIGSFANGCMSHNTAFHNGWRNSNGGAGPAGIWCWDSNNITIEYNESYDNGTMKGCGDGDGFDLDGGVTNSVVQYNYSHDNWAAGYLVFHLDSTRSGTSNNTIRYNISENDNIGYPLHQWNKDHFGCLTIADACSNTKVYNNTFSSKNGPCVKTSNGTNIGTTYYNNIFYSEAPNGDNLIVIESSGNKLSNNCYWSKNGFSAKYLLNSYTSFNNFKSANSATIGNELNENPLLKNPIAGYNCEEFNIHKLVNYQLQAGSPAKDKGLDLTKSPYQYNVGSIDFNNSPIPFGSFDIGACESK